MTAGRTAGTGRPRRGRGREVGPGKRGDTGDGGLERGAEGVAVRLRQSDSQYNPVVVQEAIFLQFLIQQL